MHRNIISRSLLWQWTVFILSLCLALPSRADEVHLLNGDRLTGTILKMEERVLTLQTDYGGEVKIDWGKVESLKSDGTLKILVPGESHDVLRDFLYGAQALRETRELGPESPVPLADVTAINLEPLRLTGTVTVGGNSTSGNSSTKAFNSAARLTIQAYRQRLLLEGKYNYGQAGELVTARNSLASVKHNYFLSKQIFIESFGMLEKDTLQNLQLRSTIGSGLGYQFYESARTTLSLSLGLAHVSEHFTNSPNTQTPSGRWSLRWEHTVWPDRVKVFHRHEGFYDVNAGNAFRINADQGVRITVYKNLFFNVEYDLRLNTQPAPGREKLDESLIFGVGYEFK
jgi:putative salt-induced outer membrane protein YdiY